MRLTKYTSLLILYFVIPIFLMGQELSKEGYNRYIGTSTYTFRTEGHGQLVVKKVVGDIIISGEPIDKVEIVETISIKANSENKARELFEEVKATVKKSSTEQEELAVIVRGSTKYKKHISYTYTIRVPLIFSLMINTRGGDIEIENVKGQLELSTSGGDLDLSDLSGRVSGETSGGDIDVIGLNGRIFLRTSGGDIEVEKIKGDLNAKTSGGDIDVDNVKGSVSVKTSGGDIDLSDIDGREIYAKTSGGDITADDLLGEIDLSTSGGSIELDHIRGEIDASTSGGNIDMNDIWGSVTVWTSAGGIEGDDIYGALDARTSAGDIEITKIWDKDLEDHDIKLKTSGGDIYLTLPKNFPADFSVRSLSPSIKASESIQSEFELYITASSSHSRAKGKIGEGIYKVDLESSMGTINISKED